ncbi:hypothetical protein AGMMS49957_18680 [Synergistales bacterium]|nr:hypothetical protein AGMMS49957_18680 [Synergistales bacterium]
MASKGYPGKYNTGYVITSNDGDKNVTFSEDYEHPTMVFHASTAWNKNHELVTDGGRVFGVSSSGETVKEALKNVYARINKIHFDGLIFRKDIAYKELSRLG